MLLFASFFRLPNKSKKGRSTIKSCFFLLPPFHFQLFVFSRNSEINYNDKKLMKDLIWGFDCNPDPWVHTMLPPSVARVTMAPAFRLTTCPAVSENMSQFTVDFSLERAGLRRLHFLPGESHLFHSSSYRWRPLETVEDTDRHSSALQKM